MPQEDAADLTTTEAGLAQAPSKAEDEAAVSEEELRQVVADLRDKATFDPSSKGIDAATSLYGKSVDEDIPYWANRDSWWRCPGDAPPWPLSRPRQHALDRKGAAKAFTIRQCNAQHPE